ncbi:MAG TPA: sigma factor, partial [Byssovorax sp.]
MVHDAWTADADEMALVAQGDERAFSRLYQAHHGRVFRVAAGILGDREAALDVAHDCFLELLKTAPRWQAR